MLKHTPGPWRNDPEVGITFGPDGTAIQTGGAGCAEEFRANAFLIAAAPELLEALRILLPLLDRDHPAATQEEINRCDVCFCVAKASAAIAKATSPERTSEARG